MKSARSGPTRKVTTAALLATVSLAAVLGGARPALAEECAQGTPPDDVATPSTLYDTLRARTNAQLLAIQFLHKPVEETCAWIYEVKVLTASGSVLELDFKADDLDLVGARGPENDHDAAALVQRLGGGRTVLNGSKKNGGAASSSGKGSSGTGSGDGSGDDDGGEGGNSGSGSGGSGSGGSGSDGGDGDGGEGGSGEGGGGDSGGHGGSGGGGEGGDD